MLKNSGDLISWLEKQPPAKALRLEGRFVPIDLSNENAEFNRVANAEEAEAYIFSHLKKNDAVAAFGGYDELRSLYQSSDLFSNEDGERNIHIGLDLWAPAGTKVLAVYDATVHSFDYNAGDGNYGPTIILEHIADGLTFYTLYGHLSIESISELEIGDKFKAGETIGTLGTNKVNGGYAPHLHLQLIKDAGDWFGDYPGVCSAQDRDEFLENCPDPNLALKIK